MAVEQPAMQSEFEIRNPEKRDFLPLDAAARASFDEETRALNEVLGSQRVGKDDEKAASALIDAKIGLLKVRAGGGWNDVLEKKLRAKFERIVKAGDFDNIRHGSVGSFSDGIAISPWVGEGVRTTETRQGSGPPFEAIDLGQQGFGTYSYKYFYVPGEGRVWDLDSFAASADLRMGGLAHIRNNDADDYDAFNAYVESGLWFTYVPTHSGKLQVFAAYENNYDDNNRMLNNEHGNSRCFIQQSTSMAFGFFDGDNPVGRQYLQWGSWYTSYIGNGSADNADKGKFHLAAPGQRITLTGRPYGTLTAGKPVDILLGCRVSIEGWLDDVGATVWQGSGWRLKTLWLRVVS